MPELAEVEHFRRKWDAHRHQEVVRVFADGTKRVLREINTTGLTAALTGKPISHSQTHGKQMLFQFGPEVWLGVHLGMTGSLKVAPATHEAQKHEHLVLWTKTHALVFTDPRLFGKILFHDGANAPDWWRNLPPAPLSEAFSLELVAGQLKRRSGSPLKAVLLMQDIFPGIGNWMADEILWRSGLPPSRKSGSLSKAELEVLHRETCFVVAGALESIPSSAADFGDPPKGWFYHARWDDKGECPKHQTPLKRETIGGRTTAWCPICQKA